MRYFEISSGFRLPVSSEEEDLISRCSDAPISVVDLDERQAQLAHEMTIRGVLRRIDDDEGTYYETDRLDLWRI
jgi:hypothetical protein